MDKPSRGRQGPPALTRRGFLGTAAAGAIALTPARLLAEGDSGQAVPARLTAGLSYLTPLEQFHRFVREKPRVDELPPDRLREVGLDRETWQLEVVPDPASNCKVQRPLSKAAGTALDWQGLMKLAEKHTVRFLNVLTCTNMDKPLGMGLWEGVPLREVIWMARPTGNVRRVYYYGYHNDEPKQRFQSSLTMARVLEDPPGELPIILCYKLNGEWLSVKHGGPVRMIVPGVYGNKAVKWLQHIVLTNTPQSNDTYAEWNNDVESPMKTSARFLRFPAKAKPDEPLPLVGVAQVGMSGLSNVQYSLCPQETPLPADDPYLTTLDWQNARILPPPEDWGGGLPGGRLPPVPLQFDPATGKPRSWPLRYTIAHWAAIAKGMPAGRYRLRCRTIDANGVAQPLPRPLPKSGNNGIQEVALAVEA